MDSKERVDDEETLKKSREMILKLEQRVDKLLSELQTSEEPSAATSSDVEILYEDIQQFLKMTTKTSQDPSKALPHIHDGIHLIPNFENQFGFV